MLASTLILNDLYTFVLVGHSNRLTKSFQKLESRTIHKTVINADKCDSNKQESKQLTIFIVSKLSTYLGLIGRGG